MGKGHYLWFGNFIAHRFQELIDYKYKNCQNCKKTETKKLEDKIAIAYSYHFDDINFLRFLMSHEIGKLNGSSAQIQFIHH